MLKAYNRQYDQYMKLKVMLKNNLISLLDQTFPGINSLFQSSPRKSDGHEKWADFTLKFWHCESVTNVSQKSFAERYQRWCKKSGYNYSATKAQTIYSFAAEIISTLPKIDAVRQLIINAIAQLNTITETLSATQREMLRLASQLPECPVIMQMFGVGETLGPQLIAEIGDVRRFERKQSLGGLCRRRCAALPIKNFRGQETKYFQAWVTVSPEDSFSDYENISPTCTS